MIEIGTFVSGAWRITKEFWQFWRRRPTVFLDVEHQAKGPMIWTMDTVGQGRRKVDQLVVRVVLPPNSDALQLEECGLWIIENQRVRLAVDYGADRPLPHWIKPGDKYEWYTNLDDVQTALLDLRMTGDVRIRAIVRDVARHEYESKSMVLKIR